MQTKQNVGLQIDILEIVFALIRKIWIIVVAMIIGGIIAFFYTLYGITPLYQTSAMLYVNNSVSSISSTKVSISTADLSAAQSLVDTYIVILKSRTTLEKVIDEAKLNYNYETLRAMISANAVNSTEVFSVTVTSSSAEEAELIANTIADVLPETISMIMEGSSAKIVDYAVIPGGKASPSISKNTIMGMLIGALAACAFIVVITLLDYKIHSEDYILENYPDMPLLAVIPDITSDGRKGYYYKHYYHHYEPPLKDKN